MNFFEEDHQKVGRAIAVTNRQSQKRRFDKRLAAMNISHFPFFRSLSE
jgi:uncharacterized protein (DUF2252 family)